MYNNRGFIVEKGNAIIKKVIGNAVTFRAFAEDTDHTNSGGEPEPTPTPTINYEDLIAKARKEEKEKQYKTIEKLRGQIDTMTQQHNNDLLRVADLEKQLQESNNKLATAGSGDSEELKKANDTIKSLEKQLQDAYNDTVSREEVEADVRAELEKEYEVKHYKTTKLMELKDDILVPELVFGNTKEEIDASIQTALERSNEIKKNLGIDGKKTEKRTPKTSAPSISKVQDKEVSLDRLATMDVRSPEYAELRKQLGLR